MILRAGWVSEVRATGTVHTAKEGWGEDSKQLKNWNFGSSIISLTPSPPSPAAGFALQGRGIFGVTIQICVDNRDFEQVLRQDVPQKILAIHRKPHTVLPRAIQPRTAFSGAPCLKLSVDGYINLKTLPMPKSRACVGCAATYLTKRSLYRPKKKRVVS